LNLSKIKENLKIVDVVKFYTVQKVNQQNKMLCPFHDEKTASFAIYPDTNSYYCFGCESGGDVIRFVEKFRQVEFKEAIQILTDDFGVDVALDDKKLKQQQKIREKKQKLEKIYHVAVDYFKSQLTQEHIEFISNKYGLTQETIAKAKIGYSGAHGGILEHLRDKGFSDDEIYKSGLVTKTNGQLKDMFYNRIMIPYLKAGQVEYFTGRSLESNDDLKYLNLKHTSPEVKNPLFSARSKGIDTLLLVEGEFDALAAAELTDHDVIGLGKAGLSKHKKKDLFKLVEKYDEIIIINDLDENKAGLKGAIQTARAILERTGIVCRVVQLEKIEGLDSVDVADYNRENKDIMRIIETSQRFIEFLKEDELIEVVENYIKSLWKSEGIKNLSIKVKNLIPLMKDLNRIDCNLFIEDIRRIVKNKTSYVSKDGKKKEGNKNALGSKQDFLTMINQEKKKDKFGNEFNPTMLGKKVVEDIEEKGNRWAYVLVEEKGSFYFYDGQKGYWEKESAENFKKEIREVLREDNEDWERKHKIEEVNDALKQSILADRKNLKRFDAGINPNLDLINCKSGMLDWRTGELKDHDPSYYSLFQIKADYDPVADCPKWEETLREWIDEEYTIKFLQEFAGYCLIPDTSHQKALILYGAGSNGKSVFLEVLNELLGPENCGGKSLSQINERFGHISIKDNLANICPDIDSTYLKSTGITKNIIRGEKITGEYKGKDLMDFTPICRLLFSCNELPKSRDKSDGWLRSFEIVKFKNKFKPTDPNFDPDLKEKLLNEKNGIFNWAIDGLRRLKKQGNFTLSDEIKEAKEGYQKENDTVRSFIDDVCELNPAATATTEYLFRTYLEYCDECNYKPVNRNRFVRTLKWLGLRKVRTTFEVCKKHGKLNCDKCYNQHLTKKQKRGFKGLKID